jgi:hypothetical protein
MVAKKWIAAWTTIGLVVFVSFAQAATYRIMPVGDSITAGYTDNPTWTSISHTMHALFRQVSELTHDVIGVAIELQSLSVTFVFSC